MKPFGRLGNNIVQIIKVISLSLSLKHQEKIKFTYLKKQNPNLLKNFPDYLNTKNINGTYYE